MLDCEQLFYLVSLFRGFNFQSLRLSRTLLTESSLRRAGVSFLQERGHRLSSSDQSAKTWYVIT